MTTSSSPSGEHPSRYSNRPCPANRRTSNSISWSVVRPPDANEASGRPMRRSCARSAAAALNAPKPTEEPSKQAMIFPPACTSSLTRLASRAETVAGAARRPLFVPGARKLGRTSGMGVNRIELVFQQRPVLQPELDRNLVKPARCKAAIEMPHSWNDHPDDRNADVGARLIEDEEIETLALGKTHAGAHLLARVETSELRGQDRLDRRTVAWHQEGVIPQAQRSDAVKARFVSGPVAHEADGQELVELRQRTQ